MARGILRINICLAFMAEFKQLKSQHEELCAQETCSQLYLDFPSYQHSEMWCDTGLKWVKM